VHRFLTCKISFSVYTDAECEHKGDQAFGTSEEKGRRGEEGQTHGKKIGYKSDSYKYTEVSEQSLK